MDPMDTHYVDEEEQHNNPQITSPERLSPHRLMRDPTSSAMTVSALAAPRIKEICNDHHEDPSTDTYGVELLRRAIMQGDQDARIQVQECLSETVRGWLHCHPSRKIAHRLDNEEHYLARAFERFWHISTYQQQPDITSLNAALRYLLASLNGVVLDTLRAYSRPREFSLPEPGEPQMEDSNDNTEVWDILKTILSSPREQRLAYLLFHCGLKPEEIVHCFSQEFSDVREIYRLRRNIMEWLQHNMISNPLI
jgi:hypothetical protein